MKAVLKLIRLELSFLKTSIIFIGIILILFTGALLSTISVRIDVPQGMYENLDKQNTYITFTVYNVPLGEALTLGGDLMYGRIVGITSEVDAEANGKTVKFLQTNANRLTPVGSNAGGLVLPENFAFSDLEGTLSEGRFPTAAGEALLGSNLAAELEVHAGSAVNFGEKPFTVAGVYDYDRYFQTDEGAHLPHMSFFVVMSSDTVLDAAIFDHDHMRSAMENFERAQKANYNVELLESLADYAENIDLAEAFFSAMAFVLGVMVLFILYSLMAIFFRQRKSQICRLKLLGAKDSLIAGVYCWIAVALVLAAVVVGAAISIGFNLYYMGLCSALFNVEFPSHFYIGIPAALLAVMVLFSLLLFAFYQHKIKKVAIAQEVKNE